MSKPKSSKQNKPKTVVSASEDASSEPVVSSVREEEASGGDDMTMKLLQHSILQVNEIKRETNKLKDETAKAYLEVQSNFKKLKKETNDEFEKLSVQSGRVFEVMGIFFALFAIVSFDLKILTNYCFYEAATLILLANLCMYAFLKMFMDLLPRRTVSKRKQSKTQSLAQSIQSLPVVLIVITVLLIALHIIAGIFWNGLCNPGSGAAIDVEPTAGQLLEDTESQLPNTSDGNSE